MTTTAPTAKRSVKDWLKKIWASIRRKPAKPPVEPPRAGPGPARRVLPFLVLLPLAACSVKHTHTYLFPPCDGCSEPSSPQK
jgi:hypothetical protein